MLFDFVHQSKMCFVHFLVLSVFRLFGQNYQNPLCTRLPGIFSFCSYISGYDKNPHITRFPATFSFHILDFDVFIAWLVDCEHALRPIFTSRRKAFVINRG
jgi:hypothetical protein